MRLLEGAALLLAHVLSWAAVVHALLNKRDPRSALGWSVTALFLPGLGALLYLIFGISRAESHAARLMGMASLLSRGAREKLYGGKQPDSPPGHVDAAALPIQFRNLARIGSSLAGRGLSGGNSVTPLFNGDEAYPAMLEAVERAERHVWLTTYIFTGGRIGEAFRVALARAARRGVDVRVLVDGIGGSIYSLARPWRQLARQGAHVARFLPPRIFPPHLSLNLRNHRKILVCDATGFTGGMNIADYHVSSSPAYSVQDIHFLCSGPIVAQLREAFLLDWGFCTGSYMAAPAIEENPRGNSLCRMVLDGPGSGRDPLHDLLCGVIAGARRHIRIMTPYFLPTHEMMASLRSASLRGVEICVTLPAHNNLPYVHWAAQHLLPGLLEAGVRVFYQPPPFAHTKLLMVDSFYTQFGSANLDPRSLRLNFELNIETFDTSFTRNLEKWFDKTRSISCETTPEALARFSLPVRLRNAACWVFSPYL